MKRSFRKPNPLLRCAPLPRAERALNEARWRRRIAIEIKFHRYSIREDNDRGWWWWGRSLARKHRYEKKLTTALQRADWRWFPFW